MKKQKRIIIIGLLTITAMLFSFEGSNEGNSFIGTRAHAFQFCKHGTSKSCYHSGSGTWECGEGPWIDCSGTFIQL